MKHKFALPRPEKLNAWDYYKSFPSGHSAIAMMLYLLIKDKITEKTYKKLFIFVPILVGLSRAILKQHYPSDVIYALLLGYITTKVSLFILKKTKKQVNWFKYLVYSCMVRLRRLELPLL